MLIHALFAGAFFIHFGASYVKQEMPTLTVFDVVPSAAPLEPEIEMPPDPEAVEKEKPLPEPDRPKIEPPKIRISSITLDIKPAPDPAPSIERTMASESKPARLAPQVSDAKPTWQGQVLAALNKADNTRSFAHFGFGYGNRFVERQWRRRRN